MTITNAPSRQAFDDLVQLVIALRPTWQAPGVRAGIKAALNREQSFTFADLVYAVVACACDPEYRTPATFAHDALWRKGAPVARIYGIEEGDPRHVCAICSMTEAACAARARTNGHEFRPRVATDWRAVAKARATQPAHEPAARKPETEEHENA